MKKRQPTWTKRSRESLEEAGRLQDDLARCGLQITLLSERIVKNEEAVARLTEATVTSRGQGWSGTYLQDHLRVLEAEKLERSSYEKHVEGLRAQIAALENPTASQQRDRLGNQRTLAALAARRLAKDVAISGAVERLQEMLQERDGLTSEMQCAAGRIGLDLDERSFKFDLTALAMALRTDLAEQSKRWTDRFLGRSQALKRKRYAILRHPLKLPETLASTNFYGAESNEVSLTDDEARPLLSSREPAIKSLDQEAEKLFCHPARKKTLTVRWGGVAVE